MGDFSNSLRGNLQLDTTQGDISLQIIDWKTTDKEIVNDNSSISESDLDNEPQEEYNYNYLITIFGLTDNNKSICIDINGFQPYFYVKTIFKCINQGEFGNKMQKMSTLHIDVYIYIIIYIIIYNYIYINSGIWE